MGKFVKVAGGIFSTHSKDSDANGNYYGKSSPLVPAGTSLEKVDQCIKQMRLEL